MLRHSSKILLILVLMFHISILFLGCSPTVIFRPPSNQVDTSSEVSDSLEVEPCPSRVVALMGSLGEMWLDAGGTLIGVTSDAIEERGFKLPKDINILGSVKEPNLELIISLEPDFVILSPNISSHLELAETLDFLKIPYGYFDVETFPNYLSVLKIFCAWTGSDDLYIQNGLHIEKKIADILEATGSKFAGKSALFIRAFSTGSKAKGKDSMTGAMIEDFGLENIVDKYNSLLEELSIEEIIHADPDYIFVVTMGSDSKKALDLLYRQVQNNNAWSNLSAVKNNRYYMLPKELFHYKPNKRWSEAYAYLNEILSK